MPGSLIDRGTAVNLHEFGRFPAPRSAALPTESWPIKATLAIYDALLQARIPPPAARGVAEALEKDMEALLATKTDLRLLSSEMDRRFERLEQRIDRMDERLERLIIERTTQLLDQNFARQVDARFQALEERMKGLLDQNYARQVDERFTSLELRLIVKLGSLIVATSTALVAILKFL